MPSKLTDVLEVRELTLPPLPCFGTEEISTRVAVADIDKVEVDGDDFSGRYFTAERLQHGANTTCDAVSSASCGPEELRPPQNVGRFKFHSERHQAACVFCWPVRRAMS